VRSPIRSSWSLPFLPATITTFCVHSIFQELWCRKRCWAGRAHGRGRALVESKRQADGRWLLDRAYDEALGVACSESVGEPSRWNTLRALRVLRWWEQGRLAEERCHPKGWRYVRRPIYQI
jgi:hypothetical protein